MLLSHFKKTYSVPCSAAIHAVDDASFAVDKGECFALLGVNGAGKSTTFKSLTNVINATSGQVLMNGLDVTANFTQVRHLIGYCP